MWNHNNDAFLCCSIQSPTFSSYLFEIICSLVFIFLLKWFVKNLLSSLSEEEKFFCFYFRVLEWLLPKFYWDFGFLNIIITFIFFELLFCFLLHISFNFQLIRSRFDCLEEKWTTAMRKERLWDRGLQTIFFIIHTHIFMDFFSPTHSKEISAMFAIFLLILESSSFHKATCKTNCKAIYSSL